MTVNEAIEYLNNHYLAVGHILNPPKEECENHNSVMDMAIQALEEIQQYRSIGTVEEFKALKEKAEPKKPIIKPWSDARCPSCNCSLSESLGDGYYQHFTSLNICDCGQKLDWT